jgi:hypothetical protein
MHALRQDLEKKSLNPLTASHFFIEFIICIAYFQEAIALMKTVRIRMLV